MWPHGTIKPQSESGGAGSECLVGQGALHFDFGLFSCRLLTLLLDHLMLGNITKANEDYGFAGALVVCSLYRIYLIQAGQSFPCTWLLNEHGFVYPAFKSFLFDLSSSWALPTDSQVLETLLLKWILFSYLLHYNGCKHKMIWGNGVYQSVLLR